MAYGSFARFYDGLTADAEYEKRADYCCSLLRAHGIDGGILLDLGCGTGSMSILMAERGYSVIGVDISADMLSEAREKAGNAGADILFLNQDMTELDLYGTISACISVLDCVNHLDSPEDVAKTFEKVSLFTERGGLFIFDVNTVYKHRNVLSDNAFVFENDDVYCVWQNELCDDDSVDVSLDFFEKSGDGYTRYCEFFTERAYPLAEIEKTLSESGFDVLGIYDDLSGNGVNEETERAVFVARKR